MDEFNTCPLRLYGSIMYITSIDGTTSTTTAYIVTPTVLVKVLTHPTMGTIKNIVTNVIRYNHFLTDDVPFQMPSID